ncbi:MAG: F0F1 ATP synthase subunit A [Candidatus Vogelbacteria bacterium]|nr:F0F1 ATP synthase subunit A [Candidatus Vogelbacteria bacterium]
MVGGIGTYFLEPCELFFYPKYCILWAVPEISIKAEEIFYLGSFPVTNALLVSILVLIFILAVVMVFRKKLSIIPGTLQSALEIVIEEVLGLSEPLMGSMKKAEEYLPLIVTIFFFVLFSNWAGLLPGFGSIGLYEPHGEDNIFIPLLRAPSSDLNLTLALAIIAILSVNIFGVLAIGLKGHLKKFFNFKDPIMFFVGILELLSEGVKIVSLAFRLFGNVFAGEVLLTIIGVLAPYLFPLPFLFMEVLVGVIQAFIFSMLTLVFVSMSISHEEAH